MTSPDPTVRTLALLGLLQHGRPWSAVELAGRLGVSTRTLRRDVDRLRSIGYDVQTRPGPGGEYRLRAGSSIPPLFFDDDEVTALVAGLRMMEPHLRDDGAAERALAKLEQLLPGRLASVAADARAATQVAQVAQVTVGTDHERSAEGQPADSLSAASLTELARASAESGRVTFDYEDQHGRSSARRVDPRQLVPLRGHWYLVGYDTDREAWRTFRLDRVREVRRCPGRFRPHPLPSPSALEYLTTDFGRRPAEATDRRLPS